MCAGGWIHALEELVEVSVGALSREPVILQDKNNTTLVWRPVTSPETHGGLGIQCEPHRSLRHTRQ